MGDLDSDTVGIFPDVLNDAYEFGLINDIEEDDDGDFE